jgi:hypothetical protein
VCDWVGTADGGRAPYTFTWRSQGEVIPHASSDGSDTFEITSEGSAFDIVVDIRDVYGQWVDNSISVDVQPSHDGC